jgi:hypothetical protein
MNAGVAGYPEVDWTTPATATDDVPWTAAAVRGALESAVNPSGDCLVHVSPVGDLHIAGSNAPSLVVVAPNATNPSVAAAHPIISSPAGEAGDRIFAGRHAPAASSYHAVARTAGYEPGGRDDEVEVDEATAFGCDVPEVGIVDLGFFTAAVRFGTETPTEISA